VASVVATQKKLTSLKERRSLTEPRVICVVAEEWGKSKSRGHIPIYRNQPHVETMVLKSAITKGRNPEHRDYTVYINTE